MGSVATRGGARQRARAWSARRPAMRQRVTEAGQRRGIVWESVSSRDGASRPRNAREGGMRLDVGLPVRKPRRCRTTFGKISGARARGRARGRTVTREAFAARRAAWACVDIADIVADVCVRRTSRAVVCPARGCG